MKENERYVARIIIRALAVMLVEIILLFFFTENKIPNVLGLVLGGLVSIVFLYLIYLNVLRAIDMSEKGAKVFMMANYYARYALAGIVLYMAFKLPYFNIFTCALGLLSIKLGLFIGNVFDMLKSRKKKERRNNGY